MRVNKLILILVSVTVILIAKHDKMIAFSENTFDTFLPIILDEYDGVIINNPPRTPTNPSPTDNGTDQSIELDLYWVGGDPDGDVVTYDVYLEAENSTPEILVSANKPEENFDPGTLVTNTEYFWQIIATDEHGATTTGPVWSFITGNASNNSPNTPSNPSPEDGALSQSIEITLRWTGGDSDGDTVTYDVYFEANDSTPDVLVSNNQPGVSFDTETLNPNTVYYWQIIAFDEHNASSPGPIWNFTTTNPPYVPRNPDPANSDLNQSVEMILQWVGGDPDGDVVTYDVYFEAGNSTPGLLVSNDQLEEYFDAGTLTPNTQYYWQIIATDENNLSVAGEVWNFQTTNSPYVPSNPSPTDNATNQSIEVDMSWVGGDPDGDAVTYDVYLEEGNSTPDILVSSSQSGAYYDPGILDVDKEYFWQIVVTDEFSATATGPVWSFTTGNEILSTTQVIVSAGSFQMGCDSSSDTCDADEIPLHTVELDEYYIDEFEVTNAQYGDCVSAGICSAPLNVGSSTRASYYNNPEYSNYPVIYVSWTQANNYCQWLGKRLPTEAEWEKAARGSSDTRKYPWGFQAPSCILANFIVGGDVEYCVGDTTYVGGYPAGVSPYGIANMAGNVLEWIADYYQPDYYSTYEPDSWPSNPTGPVSGYLGHRVMRGGGWNQGYDPIRVPSRTHDNPNFQGPSVGFRCAMDAAP